MHSCYSAAVTHIQSGWDGLCHVHSQQQLVMNHTFVEAFDVQFLLKMFPGDVGFFLHYICFQHRIDLHPKFDPNCIKFVLYLENTF